MKGIFRNLITSIVLIIIISSIVGGLVVNKKVTAFDQYMNDLTLKKVNLEEVEDGSYKSRIDTGVIIVEVDVLIENHIIKSIDLIEHSTGQGYDAVRIIDDIIDQQSTVVDVIAGETLSSQVIMKAVENALIDH